MTDEAKALVAELRLNDSEIYLPILGEAAFSIEILSAENERLREALLQMKRMPNYIRKDDNRKEMLKIINAALGETK